MHEWISSNLPDVKLPSLPSKLSTFFKSSSEESARRASAIQAILDAVLGHPLLRAAVFIDNFFENTPEINASASAAFPFSGSLYINVYELHNCNNLGTVVLKSWPGLCFWLGSPASSYVSNPIAPGEKVFAEFLSYERRSQDLCAFFQLFAGPRNTGVFAEIDISKIIAYQMHDITVPLQGSAAPQGAAMRLLIQFSPCVIPKPKAIRLNPVRLHLHKQSWLPGDVLRGTVIFANPKPIAITTTELHLICTQSVGWTHAKTTGYGNTATTIYRTISEVVDLAASRRVLAGDTNGSQSVLAPGWHCWPFEFLIPTDAPPTGMVPGDIVMHANANYTSWNLVFMSGFGVSRVQIPIYVSQPERSKEEHIRAAKVSLRWDKNANGAAQDSDSDEESAIESEEEEGETPQPQTAERQTPQPRSRHVSYDGVIYEDWSQLPENLLIGSTYRFVYRIINNSPKEITRMKITFVSKMIFTALRAPKDHNTGLGECTKQVLVDSNAAIRPGQQSDWAIDFTIPLNTIATSYSSMGSPMVSSSNSVAFKASFPGIWNWSSSFMSYHVSAPKMIPTVMYTRPNSPKFPFRPGVPFFGVGSGECPPEHPHIPFSYFSPFPSNSAANLGKTPLRPVSSWFYPLQAPTTYPVSPANVVLPATSDFAAETILVPLKEPNFGKAIEILQKFAQSHPADAETCAALIAAIVQSSTSGQTFQNLASVQSSVDRLVVTQSLDATSDEATLTSEITNRETTALKETHTDIKLADHSMPSKQKQEQIKADLEEEKTMTTEEGEGESVAAPVEFKQSNRALAESAFVIDNQRSSMSLRKSVKISQRIV